MTEGQPPGEAAVTRLHSLANVSVEQLDTLEEAPRHALNHRLDLLAAHRIGYEQRKVELRRGSRGQRLVSSDNPQRTPRRTMRRLAGRSHLTRRYLAK